MMIQKTYSGQIEVNKVSGIIFLKNYPMNKELLRKQQKNLHDRKYNSFDNKDFVITKIHLLKYAHKNKNFVENSESKSFIILFLQFACAFCIFNYNIQINNMSKQVQKKFIEINHALSGYHGQQLKNSAFHIYQTRKQILKKLQRKKKLAVAINDQLYAYLEKYPEQKLGLHQQSFKKKKAKLLQGDEKGTYASPAIEYHYEGLFGNNQNQYFLFPFDAEPISSEQQQSQN